SEINRKRFQNWLFIYIAFKLLVRRVPIYVRRRKTPPGNLRFSAGGWVYGNRHLPSLSPCRRTRLWRCARRKPSCTPARDATRYSGRSLLSSMKPLPLRTTWLAAALSLAMLPAGCGRGRHRVLDVAYVSAPQATLRDQVAAIYTRVGTVKNGERVEITE